MPRTKKLTKSMIDTYMFACEFYQRTGRFPTLRVIVDNTGISSTSVASLHITRLVEHGFLKLYWTGSSRHASIVGGTGWRPPEAYYKFKYQEQPNGV